MIQARHWGSHLAHAEGGLELGCVHQRGTNVEGLQAEAPLRGPSKTQKARVEPMEGLGLGYMADNRDAVDAE